MKSFFQAKSGFHPHIGLNFKYLLYQYAQIFFEKLKESKLNDSYINPLMEEYLHYMTLFKLVCLFPDEDFFYEISSIITALMEAKYNATMENTNNSQITEVDIEVAFIAKMNELIDELYQYQTNAILNSEEENIEPFLFSNYTFDNPNDKTKQHVDLWNNVQHYVNTYIKCENPLDRFDINIQNTSEVFEYVLRILYSIKQQINDLKSRYHIFL